MTVLELTQVAVGAVLLLTLGALVSVFMLNRRVKRLLHNQRVIMGSAGAKDLIGHVTSLDQKVNNLRTMVEELAVSGKDHEARIDGCLSGVGVVRFDAYDDLGGRQSTSVAFIDASRNGVVITTVVSREFARMYVKTLKNGRPDVPLAPEEIEAFEQAQSWGNMPFTVMPRPPIEDYEQTWEYGETGESARARTGRQAGRSRGTGSEAASEPGADETAQSGRPRGWPKLEPSVPSHPEEQGEDETQADPQAQEPSPDEPEIQSATRSNAKQKEKPGR